MDATPLLVLLVLGRRLVTVLVAAPALMVVALGVRLLLPFFGGRPLLTLASIGIVAVVLALAMATARAGTALMPGVFMGLALAATTHAALGTWGAVWRRDLPGLLVALALAALVVVSLRPLRDADAGAPPARLCWLVFPVVLIAGITLANPARALTPGSWGAVVVALAATVASAVAVSPAVASAAVSAAPKAAGVAAARRPIPATTNGRAGVIA